MSVGNPRSLLSRVLSCTTLATLALTGTLLAQGITTGAVRGRVTDEAGNGVLGAVIMLTNTSTGLHYRAQTREGGIYAVENVTPGGPYTLESRAIGYRPVRREGFHVALGQAVNFDLTMSAATVELAAVTVIGTQDPLTSTARTGAASYFTDSALARMPVLSRNFTDFMNAVPTVVGTSVAGQNNRYNSIQIDGGVNNDLFGLGSTGTPGGQVGERPISLEAIKEFQVLIAPFDVRQGGFTGGLVNAVTRSGTNELHGSAFFFGQNQGFGRKVLNRGTLAPDTLTTFHEYQYGATLSGPIIRDRLHFFAAADIKSRASPFFGSLGGVDSLDLKSFGIKKATADRVAQWATTNLGVNPGTAGTVTNNIPDHDLFIKLNGQVTEGSQLELTFNSVGASQGSLIRATTYSCCRDAFELGNAGYSIKNTTNTLRARYNSAFMGRYTNELLVGYSAIRDNRPPAMMTPLVFVGGDAAGTAVSVGAERFSQGNKLNQDIIEVSDNLTIGLGSHLVTLGTHNEFFKFHNEFFSGSYGVWVFANVDSLYANKPYHYEIAVPQRPGGPTADFQVSQYGLYAQDVWTATPKLNVTLGLRVDAPRIEAPFGGQTPPGYNAPLGSIIFAHVNGDTDIANTGAFSLANLWSPRAGFNYDANGDQSLLVRGGVGVFSGRPPYVWVSNAFANSGLTQALLQCGPTSAPVYPPVTKADTQALAALATVPGFVPTLGPLVLGSPTNQPTSCVGGGTASAKASVVYFDHNFKFPQTMRAALGADKRLPWGMVGTVDLLYTSTLNQFYLNDVNLKGIVGRSVGEGNRPLYGTINASSGSATAARINTTAFNDVIRQSNSNGDYSYQGTVQINKRFSDHLEFNAGYTYSKTYDRMCLTSSISNSNLRFAVLQGTLDDRPLATSCFDVPHTIKLSGTFDIPLGVRASLMYTGQSGTPFTYTVNNDANADGLSGNDPMYVPLNASDVALMACDSRGQNCKPGPSAAYDSLFNYINGVACLNNVRGTLLARNTCRNPWQSFINARLSKVFRTFNGQSFEVNLDVFNLPNLLRSSWGVIHSTSGGFENMALLQQVGYSSAFGRGLYTLTRTTLAGTNAVQLSTRYRVLLSGRYTF
jgi:hypothetical protein